MGAIRRRHRSCYRVLSPKALICCHRCCRCRLDRQEHRGCQNTRGARTARYFPVLYGVNRVRIEPAFPLTSVSGLISCVCKYRGTHSPHPPRGVLFLFFFSIFLLYSRARSFLKMVDSGECPKEEVDALRKMYSVSWDEMESSLRSVCLRFVCLAFAVFLSLDRALNSVYVSISRLCILFVKTLSRCMPCGLLCGGDEDFLRSTFTTHPLVVWLLAGME